MFSIRRGMGGEGRGEEGRRVERREKNILVNLTREVWGQGRKLYKYYKHPHL